MAAACMLPRCDPAGAPRQPRRPRGAPKETTTSKCCRTPTYLADPGICCSRDRTPRLPRCDPAGAPRRPRRPRGAPKETIPAKCCCTSMYLADPGICCSRDQTPRLPRCDPAGAPRAPAGYLGACCVHTPGAVRSPHPGRPPATSARVVFTPREPCGLRTPGAVQLGYLAAKGGSGSRRIPQTPLS